jgi:hypothetical protein
MTGTWTSLPCPALALEGACKNYRVEEATRVEASRNKSGWARR